jgi:hypothetical protein
VSSDLRFWKCDPSRCSAVLPRGTRPVWYPALTCCGSGKKLLGRWPDLKDVLEPSEFDLDESPEDAQRYVLLTLALRQLESADPRSRRRPRTGAKKATSGSSFSLRCTGPRPPAFAGT